MHQIILSFPHPLSEVGQPYDDCLNSKVGGQGLYF